MSGLHKNKFIPQSGRIIRVNDYALPSEKMTVFFKKVVETKSDGFVAIVGQTVFVIDGGREDDYGVLNYLLSIREEWLKHNPQLLEDEQAKLAIQLIITHAHNDHIPAAFHLVRSPFIRIENVFAPPRAALADTDQNPILTECENQFIKLQDELQRYGHTSVRVTHLRFGEHRTSYEDGNCRMELFAPPIDWSEDERYALICEESARMYAVNNDVSKCNGVLNNNSIWAKLIANGQVVLFTGDQRDNALALDYMIQFHGTDHFKCDVLKYIHHGAERYSSYLYQVTQPVVTIFTDLKSKIYPETFADAEQYGEFYCTIDADVIVQMDGNSIQVNYSKIV